MPNVNIVTQPISRLVNENTSVTFSVSGSLAGTSLSANPVVYLWQTAAAGSTSFTTAPGTNNTANYTVLAVGSLDDQTYRARLSAAGVDAAVFSDVVTLAIRTSAESPYDKYEANTFESGQNRFRRLWALGYV
jgi:hypothetical protein